MIVSLLFLATSFLFSQEDAALSYQTACKLVKECTPRDAGTIQGKTAAYRILDAVSSVGVDARVDHFKAKTPKGMRDMYNVYATFINNPTSEWTVVISHFDTKSGIDCPGANDGASTTGLLVGIANALTRWVPPVGNIMLIWTDGEECMQYYSPDDGLHGSRRAVQEIKRRGYKVQAAICVDMLGDKDLGILIPRNSSMALANIAKYAAAQIGETSLVKSVDDVVKDDHVPFMESGIKAINLIDFHYGTKTNLNDLWHTKNDTIENISKDSLLKSGRLVLEMLRVLHQSVASK